MQSILVKEGFLQFGFVSIGFALDVDFVAGQLGSQPGVLPLLADG